ncbi:flavodoxin family protein [Planctomycetota bacterium]
MARILVLYHSQEYMNTAKMAEAIAKGARDGSADVILVNTNEERLDIEAYRACDGVAIGSPDYYSYIAGGLKMFFDDWYIVKGKNPEGLENKSVGIFFSHGGGGSVRGPLETLALKLGPQVGQTIESRGAPDDDVIDQCEDLGRELANTA